MITVGIPRALLYYQFYPMWKSFFTHLGGEVVVSEPTSRAALSRGSARLVAETCLPVKVYAGHVMSLVGKCDFIFIPSIKSIEERVYNCSKFLGLPDVMRATVPNCPPIVDPDIDINLGPRALHLAIYALGRRFTWNPLRVKAAAEAAWQTHLAYQRAMHEGGLNPLEAAAQVLGEEVPNTAPKGAVASPREEGPRRLTIAVIGHPYLVYDEYVNHRLLERLRGMGVRVVTPEMARQEDLEAGVARLVGRPYWTFEDEVIGAGGHYLESEVDGVLSVVGFGCGPDSVMLDVLQRRAKQGGAKPYMALTIDEHTAEAGLLTRLEAFADMLERRKRGG